MAGKFRHRINNKAKIRVPKGMTCESNPSANRHRAAALAARNASIMTSNMVAVDDLPEPPTTDPLLDGLDSMSLGGGGGDFSSSKSMVSEGGLSRISQFTNCTNPAFDSVHRVWKSGSSMQKEVVSVLAAVAEVIKERDGNETDVEYFGALLTALEGAPIGDSPRTAATAFLLQLIVKRVPKEVLQSQFTKTTQIVYMKLLENNESADGVVLKSLLSVFGVVLRAQPAVVWHSGSTRNMLITVASLCTHERPWVRTMSRRVVRAILCDPVAAMDNGLHPASSAVGQFLHQALESGLNSKNGTMQTVRYLCLLEGIMHKMPSNLFKLLSESILKSFAIADSMVKCSALQCLHRALERQPCDAALSVETNTLLISALRQLAPPDTDVAVSAYWMQSLSEALVCLSAKSPAECAKQLMPNLELFVKAFDVANEQLATVAYKVLSRVIEHCIQDNEQAARTLLAKLDEALKLQSTTVWKFILRTQMRLYQFAGESISGPEFTKALTSLAQLRQNDRCFCKAEIEFTIGSAVRHVGAPAVLNVLPLGIDPDAAVLSTDFQRSWLIPVLRVNLYNAPLSLFVSYFLPMAIKIYRRLPNLDGVPQRLYSTFQMQLWELLPSFCESPSDLEKTFPELAPVLGAALNERKDLRLTVLTALRRALKFSFEPDAPPERLEVIARYAKNFMPLLFNMYTNSIVSQEYDDKGVRIAVLETIRVYAEATPSELLSRFVDSALTKWSEVGDGPDAEDKQARILDILCALVRCADEESLTKVMDTINPWFTSTSIKGLQKKAYRILEEILARSELETFLEGRKDDVENALSRPYGSVTAPARASFIGCLRLVFDSLGGLDKLTKFCTESLEFVVLSLDKSNNVHARSQASKLIQAMCIKLITAGAEVEEHPSTVLGPVLTKIFEMATPANGKQADVELTIARSTLVALNIIVQKQMKVLNATHTSRIVSHGCLWMGDGRPPVRLLAIRLLRVLVQKMPEFAMHQYRELLLTSIFQGQLTCDLTVKVRKANRLLLEVLVEKFGIDILQKYTDKPEWLKQMKNIEKIRRRKAAKAAGENEEAESDEDNMSSAGSRTSARTAGADTILELLEDSDKEDDSENELETRSRPGSVWLRDDGEGETTDLLDKSNMIGRVTTTDPALLARRKAKMLEKKNDTGFRFTREGKIIILDDDEDIYRSGRKRKNGLDDLDEKVSGKKQKEDSDIESDFDEDSDLGDTKKSAKSVVSAATSYRPGGRGIHRDLNKDKKREKNEKKPKGQKNVQPYAYVPLRQKGGKQDVRKILKAQRKSGKSHAK